MKPIKISARTLFGFKPGEWREISLNQYINHGLTGDCYGESGELERLSSQIDHLKQFNNNLVKTLIEKDILTLEEFKESFASFYHSYRYEYKFE